MSEPQKDKEKDKGQRRVYMLPSDLMDRLVRYQRDLGIASEAEAVRRLLDGALKSRDTHDDLIERFQERLKEIRDLADAAKEVLVGHPHVAALRFQSDKLEFDIKGGGTFAIDLDGKCSENDGDFGWSNYLTKTQAAKRAKTASFGAFGRSPAKGAAPPASKSDLDDDIPF
jgi:hypothetical protein